MRLFCVVDARLDHQKKMDVARELSTAPECCLDSSWSLKARRIFPSAVAMMQSREFTFGLACFCRKARLLNMNVERLLALLRKVFVSERVPHLLRIVGSGFLAQWLRDHRAVVGKSVLPVLTRSECLEIGVPLNCRQQLKSQPQKRRAHVLYAAAKAKTRSKNGERVTRKQYGKNLKADIKEFKESSSSEQARYEAFAHAHVLEAPLPPVEPSHSTTRVSDILFGLADADFPFGESHATRTILEETGSDDVGGFSSYKDCFQQLMREHLIVSDDGDVPSHPIRHRVSCMQAHPGLCRHQDHRQWVQLESIYKG